MASEKSVSERRRLNKPASRDSATVSESPSSPST